MKIKSRSKKKITSNPNLFSVIFSSKGDKIKAVMVEGTRVSSTKDFSKNLDTLSWSRLDAREFSRKLKNNTLVTH